MAVPDLAGMPGPPARPGRVDSARLDLPFALIRRGRQVLCGLGAALAWSALSLPILVIFGRASIEAAPPAPLLGGHRAAAGFALHAAAGIWAIGFTLLDV
jgi:hypothetical protein